MIGFIGGTGPEGKGLGLRLALAGQKIMIGSRDEKKATATVKELANVVPKGSITGNTNSQTAAVSDIVFIAVPFVGQKETLLNLKAELVDKIVVVVVAPLVFNKRQVTTISIEEGSAAEQAQVVLPQSLIVSAFQNLSADELLLPDLKINADVIVCSDHAKAKTEVIALANAINDVRGVDGGNLQNSRYVEDFTALLLNINRIYKTHSTIKLVGL